MSDFNPQAMISDLSKKLEQAGVPADQAKEQATKEINSMGATKTLTGGCPMGGASPMACMFCLYGHMTECHYPLTCEEAKCSHYLEEVRHENKI